MPLYLVSPDRPVSFRNDVISDFLREGIAIDYVNIICIRRGRALLSVNLERVVEVPGMTLILFPGDVVKVEEVSDDFELEYVICTESILHEAASGMEHLVFNLLRENFHTELPAVMEVAEKSIALGRVLCANVGGDYAREMMVRILRCMFIYLDNYFTKYGVLAHTGKSRIDELFGRFMYHLGAHFRESRDVKFYANMMHITPKYLSNIIVSKTGMNAKAAIDEYVIMQLKHTLKSSMRPIKDIVWDYNFSSPAFFSEYFKRHTGLTPAEFREMSVAN